MLSPAPGLLWIVALLIVPLFTLAGLNGALLPLAAILLFVIVLLLIVDASRLNPTLRKVKLQAQTPVTAYKDRPVNLNVGVELPLNLRPVALALHLPSEFQQENPVVTTASSASLAFSVTPTSRGDFLIEQAHLSSRSAWNLWQMRTQIPLSLQVKVFPDLSKDPASRHLFSTLQQGQRVQRIIGRGREVERLRDYAAGDSFDEVYWKATARRGYPVSKVFQVERTQDIYAIVDGSRLGNRNQALERFVTASLLLAVAAEKNNDNFGLVTFRDKIESFVRASHGKGHFHRCRESIFQLQPSSVSPDFAELFTFISLRIRKRALLFFLTDLSDPLLAESFARDATTITRRHIVMVDQIADSFDRPLFTGPLPETEAAIDFRLAGHLHWAKLTQLQKSLGHIGVRMQLLQPAQTTSELIGQYRNIRQRQLL